MNRKRQVMGAAALAALLRTRAARNGLNKLAKTLRLPGDWPEIPDRPPRPEHRKQPEPEEPPKAEV